MRSLLALGCAALLPACGAFAAAVPFVKAGDEADAPQIALSANDDGTLTLIEHRSRERKPEREGDMTVKAWATANRTFVAERDGRLRSVASDEDAHWQADEEV